MVRRSINKIIFLGVLLALAGSAYGADISGRVWLDLDRNGLQDVSEPGVSNIVVALQDFDTFTSITTTTAPDGTYIFHSPVTGLYRIVAFLAPRYGITTPLVGSDATIDSDLIHYSYSVEMGFSSTFVFSNTPLSHMDAGLITLVPGLQLSVRSPAHPHLSTIYVTNGAQVQLDYVVTNTGDTVLSSIFLYDAVWGEILGFYDCPNVLGFSESDVTFQQSRFIAASTTNRVEVIGLSVNFLTCSVIDTLPYAIAQDELIIIAVESDGDTDGDLLPNHWEVRYQLNPLASNAPDANADGDWMTDYEEYLADTNPTDATSHLMPVAVIMPEENGITFSLSSSSVDRIYRLWRTHDLMTDPQAWNGGDTEQIGTGSDLSFTPPDEGSNDFYRIGVRLP